MSICLIPLAWSSCSKRDDQSKTPPPEDPSGSSETSQQATGEDPEKGGDPAIKPVAGIEKAPLKPGLTDRQVHTPRRNLNQSSAGTPYSTSHWPPLAAATDDASVREFLDEADAEKRIELIKQNRTPGNRSLAPLLRRALQANSEQVRREAIRAATALAPAEASDILSAATNDESVEIAGEAIGAAVDVAEEVRLEIYRNGINSQHAAVRQSSVLELAQLRPKYSIQHLFPALEDAAPKVSEITANALEEIFGQRFTTSSTADAWWAKHAVNYDAELNPISPDSE